MTNDPQTGPKKLKIIFAGLDNAGKTSIIKALMRDFSKIATLKPTRQIKQRNYEYLGMKIGEWDLGGQRQYRNIYMKNPERIFSDDDVMIFVIDLLSEDRIPEALDYLREIIDALKSLGHEPPIYIFSHKYDSVTISGAKAAAINLSLEVRNQIRSTIDYPRFEFYRTSVYDVPSVIRAMSKILLTANPKSSVIQNIIKEFAQKIHCAGLEIIDDNSLVVGSYYVNEHIQNLMNNVSPSFLQVYDIFKKAGENLPFDEDPYEQMTVQKFKLYFYFKKFTLKQGGASFYVLACQKSFFFDESDFIVFTDMLRETLRM